ncbi:MAG TPA: hypothetical protein DC048_03060, partial [Planctomycetaceae bacterium]|nr:hypothetical protein [Planctomycetaceae bacterium]
MRALPPPARAGRPGPRRCERRPARSSPRPRRVDPPVAHRRSRWRSPSAGRSHRRPPMTRPTTRASASGSHPVTGSPRSPRGGTPHPPPS